ncbi:hypothetical protein [Mariniblastus fucicola]|uniref:Uncharacterized protein n=1 Tax=Mariniblastus fucicola TaxID=980251 RepID=A0A5B9PCK3_9BACT|nr:hypothetical protein [Mariniblastus fucicola]QEG23984.1 hypothetical protein MFFC18_38900 [Mariniblastus fucicola]
MLSRFRWLIFFLAFSSLLSCDEPVKPVGVSESSDADSPSDSEPAEDQTEERHDSKRSLYVDGFSSILGDVAAEEKLLEYADSHEMDVLLLYELHKVLNRDNASDLDHNESLASFISRAKTQYGVQRIAAIGESADFFGEVIDPYNNSRVDVSEKFDIYNLEFEFWIESRVKEVYAEPYLIPRGFAATKDGAFEFFITNLKAIRSLAQANARSITTEAYIGWTNGLEETSEEEVARLIAQNLDQLRVHAYRSRPDFAYTASRLQGLANGKPGLNVSVIFSAEQEFMLDWLQANSMESAEAEFRKQLSESASGKVKADLRLQGFTYYNYTHNENVLASPSSASSK